jgi:glycosyltransferase involved in cell wall biosynthesis
VYDQHDVVPALAGSRPAFRKLEPFFLSCERRTVAAAQVVLTPSQEQAERLRRIYDREAVVVRTASIVASPRSAPPSHDTSTGADTGADTGSAVHELALAEGRGREQGSENGRGTVFGYLGVIGEQDGVGDLLTAVDVLRQRGLTGFRVEIAGDGPALAAVREQAGRQGLDGLVRLRGWLGPPQIAAFLDEIDAMVVPDPDIEFNHYCAMNKVTHAMARGIPVVLRPLRENSRLVAGAAVEAEDMTLPAFADALETMLTLPQDTRATVGARLRDIFEAELAWDSSAARYLAAVSPARHAR